MTDLRRPVPVEDWHDFSSFNCGEADLDDWLRRRAVPNRQMNVSATWVMTPPDDPRVAAYVAMSMSSVRKQDAPDPLAKGAPNPVPAFLIGRLAVDVDASGERVGRWLAGFALAAALRTNEFAACRAVVVDALNDRARDWWERRFGFERFDDDSTCMQLFKPTSAIEATLAGL